MVQQILNFVTDKYMSNMDNMSRFQKERKLTKEANSQHSWWVVMFAQLIAEKARIPSNDSSEPRIKELEQIEFVHLVVMKAQYHDVPEVYTGDIDHNIKYNDEDSEALKIILDRMEKNFAKRHLPIEINRFLYNEDQYKYRFIKDIVKIADWLALIKEVLYEIDMGNNSMKRVYQYASDKLIHFINDNVINKITNNVGEEDLFKEPLYMYDLGFFNDLNKTIVNYNENFWSK